MKLGLKRMRPGVSPGTIEFIGEKKIEKPRIRLIDYNEVNLEEKEIGDIEEVFPLKTTPTVSWINIDGIHDVELIGRLEDLFGLHPLLLEDIVNTTQRPKFEDFGEYIYIAIKSLRHNKDTGEMEIEQISIVFGKTFVLSFQEREGDFFDPIRERIRGGKGRIRKMGTDYLAYSLVDALVDSYFITLESMGDHIEAIDEELMVNPTSKTLEAIHSLKRDAITLRRSIWPLREVVGGLERSENTLIRKPTHVFLRDLYDHTIQVVDTLESYRDIISGLTDLYLSMISNRMNEVMKVLTIIATIFIPLTFIAGIYGMNFEYMPELGWHWAYFTVWGVIVVVGVAMLLYFRRLKWL